MTAPEEFLYNEDYQDIKNNIVVLRSEIILLKMISQRYRLMTLALLVGKQLIQLILSKLKEDLKDALNEKTTLI